MKKKVAILKGGSSSEREVSLSTGEACSEAISKLGYNVKSIDTKYNFIEDLNITIFNLRIKCFKKLPLFFQS